jgi:hypothetical protein
MSTRICGVLMVDEEEALVPDVNNAGINIIRGNSWSPSSLSKKEVSVKWVSWWARYSAME